MCFMFWGLQRKKIVAQQNFCLNWTQQQVFELVSSWIIPVKIVIELILATFSINAKMERFTYHQVEYSDFL